MISRLACLALLTLVTPFARAQNVLTFDTLPAMGNAPGAVVPVASRLSTLYQATLGVRFSSGAAFIAVISHGAATPSAPNIIGGTTAAGALRYLEPIHATFVDPANPANPATTNFVSVRGDLLAVPGSATLRAFGLDGSLLGSVTAPDVSSGVLLSLSLPGIHRVEITQTSGTIGMDNFTFNNVTACPAPQAYCTAGTTTNGCNATLVSTGSARVGATSGFVVTAQGGEGQKQGLLFYGLNGTQAVPWGTGTSYLCVKSPTQRSNSSNSGGNAGQCNGTLALDWSAFVSSTPGALGTPFAGGEVVSIQAWFRDPAASLATNLSNGLSFTVCP